MEKSNLPQMPLERFSEGLAYAEDNYLNESAPHLKVDKRLLRQHFQLDGKRVLDFGCGMGGMSLWYASTWKCKVVGIDIDAQHIAIANALRQKHGLHRVVFEQRDLLQDPPEGPFDFIAMHDVAEHIPLETLREIFRRLARLLCEDGQLFVSYPPWQGPYASHVVHVTHIPWSQFLPEPILRWLIRKNNRQLVGERESDLLAAWEGLNRLTHRKLMDVLEGTELQLVWRKSHSILKRVPGLSALPLQAPPFNLLISKEFVLLKKAGSTQRNAIRKNSKL